MRGANVANPDVSKQIHGEIVVIEVLGFDDVKNDGEFERQPKIGDRLRGVRDSVCIDFDGGDEKSIPPLCEVVQKGNAIDSTRHATKGAERRCGHDRHVHFFRSDFAPVCVSLKQNKRKTFAAELVVLTGLRAHTAKTARAKPLLLARGKNRTEPFLVFLAHFNQPFALNSTVRFALSHRFRAHDFVMAGKSSHSEAEGEGETECRLWLPAGNWEGSPATAGSVTKIWGKNVACPGRR